MDGLEDWMAKAPATAERPLMGVTVLLVEDSRFASDAFRQLCLRSGARIRRADCLANARRHLKIYRPGVVIIDMGLPDGSGADLITELDRARPRIGAILATSGDPNEEVAARAAGANGFLEKPVVSIAQFQAAVLAHLPTAVPGGVPLRAVKYEDVSPDPIAYRDDLSHVSVILGRQPSIGESDLPYLTQFIASLAHSASDAEMADAAVGLARSEERSPEQARRLSDLARLVQARLEVSPQV